MHRLLWSAFVAVDIFFLAELFLVYFSVQKNNRYWLDKAGGDPQQAELLKKHNWKFESDEDHEFDLGEITR